MTIGRFVVRHAHAGGGAPSWNTRDFTIDVSERRDAWTTPVTVAGNTADMTTHPVAASGRYVRLNINRPTRRRQPRGPHLRARGLRSTRAAAAPRPRPGRVTSSVDGAPIAGATVAVTGTSLTTTTAADGTYGFTRRADRRAQRWGQKSGFQPGSTTVTVTSGTTTTANIVLSPPPLPAAVQGTVTSSAGGAPIAGATVAVTGTALSTTTAAGDGTYGFTDVPTSSRTVTSQKAGFLNSLDDGDGH